MTRLTDIWRHPIKAHGFEALEQVSLIAGQTMPWDRAWAVAHDAARLDVDTAEWAPCSNFCRGAKAPSLMAIAAQVDVAAGTVALSHPDQGAITIDPADPDDAARLIAWLRPLNPPDRAAPARLYAVPGRGLTDSDFASVSIASHASRRAMEQKMGADLSPLRFRCNLWLDDGLAPWEEFDWIGREFSIGAVIFQAVEPISRCNAIKANPETGRRDIDPLAALDRDWGHQDFGILARVVTGGTIARGDTVAL